MAGISLGTALLGTAVVGGGTALIAADAQSGAATEAGRVQERVADQQVGETRRQFDLLFPLLNQDREIALEDRSNQLPLIQTAQAANDQLNQLFGFNTAATPAARGQDFTTPNNNIVSSGATGIPSDTFDVSRMFGGNTPVRLTSQNTPSSTTQAQFYDVMPASTPSGPDLSVFFNSPGFEFRRNEALDAVNRQASAEGLLGSGNRFKALKDRADNLASGEFNNFVNTLLGVSGRGQVAPTNATAQTGNLANVTSGLTGQINQSLGNAGAARASGIVGAGNATAQGISGVGSSIGNALTLSALLNNSGTKSLLNNVSPNLAYGGLI